MQRTMVSTDSRSAITAPLCVSPLLKARAATCSSHNSAPLDLSSPLVDPGIPQRPASSDLDLRADIRFSGIDASMFVNNVLDNHPNLALLYELPTAINYRAIPLRPRTIGLPVLPRK